MKVWNLINGNGRAVANQFIIEDGNNIYFQSYNSLVAKKEDGIFTLGCDFDYSRTTSKHLHTFMEEYAPGVLYRIKQQIPSYKSFSDMLVKAINNGIINYDPDMV